MAKRAPADDVAYSPLDMSLARSVVKGSGPAVGERTFPGVWTGEGGTENRNHGRDIASSGQIPGMPKRDNLGVAPETRSARRRNPEKRVEVSPEEDRQIERLVDRIGEQLESSLKFSHLMRACMTVLCHAEAEILRYAAELRPLPRPGNANAVALAQFEQTLAKLISKSLRDAPALR